MNRRRSPTLTSHLAWIVVLVAVGLVAGVAPTGLYVLKPGPARDLSQAITVPGGDPSSGGRYLMVTVRADRATVLAAVAATFNPSWEIVPRAALIPGGESIDDYLSRAARQMTESQQVAIRVASEYLGHDVGAVRFDVDGISGPSAGGMFALEIIRQVRGGPPGAGLIVAGTGILSPDGRLNKVGGVRQKVAAAEMAGATYFIVPREEAAAAEAAAREIKIIPVDSVAEAVQALTGIGPRASGESPGPR